MGRLNIPIYWIWAMCDMPQCQYPPDIGTVPCHTFHCIRLKKVLKLLWNTTALYRREHKATVVQTIQAEATLSKSST